ncbi:MAG TPA: hypothetical protein PLT75_18560 [Spirochaetota bacterium]|nr:hypothetical protein [Spirochaetota bacterium]
MKQLIAGKKLSLPSGKTWHKDLLRSAKENAIIDESLYTALLDYLNFRHYIVHSYSFSLELDLLLPLIESLTGVYREFKSQVSREF